MGRAACGLGTALGSGLFEGAPYFLAEAARPTTPLSWGGAFPQACALKCPAQQLQSQICSG